MFCIELVSGKFIACDLENFYVFFFLSSLKWYLYEMYHMGNLVVTAIQCEPVCILPHKWFYYIQPVMQGYTHIQKRLSAHYRGLGNHYQINSSVFLSFICRHFFPTTWKVASVLSLPVFPPSPFASCFYITHLSDRPIDWGSQCRQSSIISVCM